MARDKNGIDDEKLRSVMKAFQESLGEMQHAREKDLQVRKEVLERLARQRAQVEAGDRGELLDEILSRLGSPHWNIPMASDVPIRALDPAVPEITRLNWIDMPGVLRDLLSAANRKDDVRYYLVSQDLPGIYRLPMGNQQIFFEFLEHEGQEVLLVHAVGDWRMVIEKPEED